ncbi:signal peptide peptidase SppA [Pyxidicoccus sp. QH1ED-7-1]|nr:signal peptide peptidase SppA [Pyxidicoccus xibeiensis]
MIPISGLITQGRGGGAGRFATSETVVKALRAAGRDRRSKAVVLHISSPGGVALASEQILEVVQRVARKKPVIAFMDQVCASAGYMVAVGAKEIWSTPHAVVGSIGVFAGKFEASVLLERVGVHRKLIARGENAGVFSNSRGFTPHERASLEADIEEMYQAFLGHVAKARGRTTEEIHALAEGRVYSGMRAKDLGLVDRLGGFEEACRHALGLAKVSAEHFELKTFGAPVQRFNLLKLLMSTARAQVYALCPVSWSLGGGLGTEEFDVPVAWRTWLSGLLAELKEPEGGG